MYIFFFIFAMMIVYMGLDEDETSSSDGTSILLFLIVWGVIMVVEIYFLYVVDSFNSLPPGKENAMMRRS